MASMSVSRVYADANESRGREWWDYDNLALQWGTQDHFEILQKVGRGKYSEVFEGVNMSTSTYDLSLIHISEPTRPY